MTPVNSILPPTPRFCNCKFGEVNESLIDILLYNLPKSWFVLREVIGFMKKWLLIWGLGIFLGLILIYVLYVMLGTATVLKSYEESFQLLEHPQDTTLIDAFKFQYTYSPSVNQEGAIQNQCVYLVGEVRSYSSDWDKLQAFYRGKMVTHDTTDEINVRIIPVELVSDNGASPSLDTDSTFSYIPFDVDVLAQLESHYFFWGFPKGISESGNNLYVIYIAPNCD
jgi:hypothetical protein